MQIARKESEETDGIVFVVAHSFFFKMWTSKYSDDLDLTQEEIPEPIDSVWMKNCEFLGWE